MAGRAHELTKGNPTGLIVKLALPVCFENTLWMVLTAMVNMIIGRGVGAEGLAAVGVTTYPYNFFAWFSFGFAQCISGVVGMYFGLGDKKRLREGVSTAILLSLSVGVFLAILGMVARRPLLLALHTPEEILPEAMRYLTMQYIGIIGAIAHYVLSFMMIAFGNGIDPIIDIFVLGGTGVVVSFLLVNYAGLGALSGSVGIFIGYIAACLYDIHALKKMRMLEILPGEKRFSTACLSEMLKKALPFGLQLSIAAIGGMLMQRALNAQGAVVMAAFTAATSLCSISQGIQNGCGYTMNSYVSQNYGAGAYKRIGEGIRSALLIGLILWGIIAVVYFLFGRQLLTLYVNMEDPNAEAVLDAAYAILRIMGVCSGGVYLLYLSRSCLVGIGKAAFGIFGTAAEIFGRGFTAVLFPVLLGLPGVYFAEPFSWVLCGIAHGITFFVCYRKMKKKKA